MPRRQSARVLLIAGAGGLACMVIELAAARLLAPWFGTSLVVWSNVLATVLAALALGYALGARWSRGARPERVLARVLAGAGVAAALAPHAAPRLCAALVPANITLAEAAPLLATGSLAAALVLFGPAALLIASVQPLASELVERADSAATPHAGSASGRVLAVSTACGLVGIFLTVHVLVPRLGLAATFHFAAGVLLAAAALARFGAAAAAGSAAFALAAGFAAGNGAARMGPALRDGDVLLAHGESSVQSVRVVEDRSGGADPAGWLRRLEVNECFDSYQSVWKPEPGWLGEGYYYDGFALPPWWSGGSGTWRTLVVGLGAGTALRVLEGALPAERVLAGAGIEVDPLVARFGRTWMDLAEDHLVASGLDGRAALGAFDGGWDEVVLDAYANQIEIPPHLATLEFFGRVRELLAPGGWAVANVGGFGLDDPVVVGIGRTLARAFGARVLALRVPAARNVLLYARRDAQPPEPGSPEFAAGLSDAGAVLASRARLAGSWCWIEAGAGPWLSDDRAPLELLERASIARAGRPGTLDRDAVLGAGAPLEQADAGGWEAALGAGDYARALERTLALPIEARLSARAEVFYAARDFEAVLVLADEARRRAPSADPPEDLRFLARAAAAAIWLRRPDAAAERLAELDLAIEDAARAGLEPALAAQWRAQAGEYRASGEELTATAVAVARAQVVGRTTAAIAAALALAAGLFALRGCSRFPCRPGR